MPRYFFDTANGRRDVDHDGVELAGEGDALREAIHYAGALVADDPDILLESAELNVTVRGADRAEVATVRVQIDRPN